MKYVLISISLLTLLAFNTHRADLKPDALTGKWIISDNTGQLPKMSLNFLDAHNVILHIEHQGSAKLTYTIDNTHDPIIIHFSGLDADNKLLQIDWLVKMVNDNTFQAEEEDFSASDEAWDDDAAITMVRNLK